MKKLVYLVKLVAFQSMIKDKRTNRDRSRGSSQVDVTVGQSNDKQVISSNIWLVRNKQKKRVSSVSRTNMTTSELSQLKY